MKSTVSISSGKEKSPTPTTNEKGNFKTPRGTQVQDLSSAVYSFEEGTFPTTVSSNNWGPEHPENWSTGRKAFIVFITIILVMNTTLSSSLPSGGTDVLVAHFNVTSERQIYLPVAVFLIGYIFGPIIFGPLSETHGRRLSLLASYTLYTVFTFACAMAPNWPALLVFRFFVGIGASAPPTVLGGLYSDLYPNLVSRGRAVMLIALGTNLGPLGGPILSGYISVVGWRWMFWVNLMLNATMWPFLLWLPESYEPVLLQRKMVSREKTNPLEKKALPTLRQVNQYIVKVLLRPIFMFGEPIVLFTDLYILLLYSLFFLYFEAYPIIFKGIYSMSDGQTALAFIPIGIGAFAAAGIFIWYDAYLEQAKKKGHQWAFLEKYHRLPLVCIGGPIFAVSQFWLGWAAKSNIHWIVPVLSGLPYGIGLEMLFMGLTNYLTDVYGIYSASVMASCVFSRNIAAVLLLPLATGPMYHQLGVNWACSILGFVCLAMSVIPFLFLKYGESWQKRSPFCQQLQKIHDTSHIELEVAA